MSNRSFGKTQVNNAQSANSDFLYERNAHLFCPLEINELSRLFLLDLLNLPIYSEQVCSPQSYLFLTSFAVTNGTNFVPEEDFA